MGLSESERHSTLSFSPSFVFWLLCCVSAITIQRAHRSSDREIGAITILYISSESSGEGDNSDKTPRSQEDKLCIIHAPFSRIESTEPHKKS